MSELAIAHVDAEYILGLMGDAVNDLMLTDPQGVRILRRSDELQMRVQEIVNELSGPDRYADEEVSSKHYYFSGYSRPVNFSDQIDILRSHWPNLNPDPVMRYVSEAKLTKVPNWIEGSFAYIRPGFFSDQYSEEVEEVLKALSKSLNGQFSTFHENPQNLRQTKITQFKMRSLVKRQPNSDILISWGQFGMHHRGQSLRRVREVFVSGEYGLGAKDGGTMLLTNPIRLKHNNDLWACLPGDEYFLTDRNLLVEGLPCFYCCSQKLCFGVSSYTGTRDCHGSVSGLFYGR